MRQPDWNCSRDGFYFSGNFCLAKARELLGTSIIGGIRQVALTWRTETYTYRAQLVTGRRHSPKVVAR